MELNTRDFQRLSRFIYDELGIKMPESKRTMLTGRLSKRLRALSLADFSDYCDFFFSPQGQEWEMVHLVNAVTTNKTDFFREPAHFNFLIQSVLPALIQKRKGSTERLIRIWSAGCSTGEEPYTLAMVLSDFKERPESAGFRFDILATDISSRVLDIAKSAIYPEDRIAPIPPLTRKKYLLKSRDSNDPKVRIVPDLRSMVRFGRLNFMDAEFGIRERMDIIFCRNVIIYFDRQTQEALVGKFCRHLIPGGFLFLGHSESLHGLDLPLQQVAPTVYRRI